MDERSFQGDECFPPLSTTTHLRGVGGRVETERKYIHMYSTYLVDTYIPKPDEGACLGLGE